MRLAVLSDTHGNLPALEAVLAEIEQVGVDDIVVAGDLTTGGPHPVETVRLLRERGSRMIRGNSDNCLLEYDVGIVPNAWHESEQWACMRWNYQCLDRETLDFIASLPEQRVIALDGSTPIRVVHGSPRSPSEGLYPDRDPDTLRLFREACLLPPDHGLNRLSVALAPVNEPVLACGHTHIPWKQEEGGQLVFNPGAVCGPLNGDARAQYAILTWRDGRWQVEHRAVAYDLTRIRADFQESGLLEEGGAFARAYLLSNETGRNVCVYFLSHFNKLATESGFEGCDIVPDAIWEQAAETFDWEKYEVNYPAASGGALGASPRRSRQNNRLCPVSSLLWYSM